MALSSLVFLVWVLFVSIWAKGWAVTWLPLWIFILGLAYVILKVLEYLGVLSYSVPARTRRPNDPVV
jgi:hypothetical protein